MSTTRHTISESLTTLTNLTAKQHVAEQVMLDFTETAVLSAPIRLTGSINNEILLQQVKAHNQTAFISQDQAHQDNYENRQPLVFDIGVDEVGRGPLYGSLVVAATILPPVLSGDIVSDNTRNTDTHNTAEQPTKRLIDTPLSVLTDSKKLTEAKRETLFPLLQSMATGYVLADVPAGVIDDINILQATLTGMRLACERLMVAIMAQLDGQALSCHLSKNNSSKIRPEVQFNLLIDGNKLPVFDWAYLQHVGLIPAQGDLHNCRHEHKTATRGVVTAQAWVKGDSRHTAIAAASVLAKVTRDRQLVADGLRYPGYGLASHKGYPTKAHIHAVQTMGVLQAHRRSFKPIKQALNQEVR